MTEREAASAAADRAVAGSAAVDGAVVGGPARSASAPGTAALGGMPVAPGGEHYFSAAPTSSSPEREVRLVVDGRPLLLTIGGGVFSSDRIDPGTSVLIQYAPKPPPSGALLDLGCGYGPIACALAVRSPNADVVAVDVNTRALELAESNVRRLGLDRVRVLAVDAVAPGLRFGAIYSNPPIRVGKAALHRMLERWLDRLTPDGRAYLVVHRHLGSDSLQRWLVDQSYGAERLTSVRGYRILAVSPREGVKL